MPKWTKETALKELEALIYSVNEVTKNAPYSAEHVRWRMNVQRFLSDVFGLKSRYTRSFAAIRWGASGVVSIEGWDIQAEVDEHHFRACVLQMDSAKGFLQAAWDELTSSNLEDVYHGKDTPPESSAILKIINLVEHKLRKIIRTSPSKEQEVQNALEDLFIGADIWYSREADSIEYSSKTYRPDFTIKQLNLAIDIKCCVQKGREKKIIAEINDDILAYQTKYGNLLFIVYDVGQIRDSDRFSASFEAHNNVIVRVVKH